MRWLDPAWWNHVRYEYPDRFALCCGVAVAALGLGGYGAVSALGGGTATGGVFGLTGRHPAGTQPHSTSLAFALPTGVAAGPLRDLLAGAVPGSSPGVAIAAPFTEAGGNSARRQGRSGSGPSYGPGATTSPSGSGGTGVVVVTTVATPTTTTGTQTGGSGGGGTTTVVATTTVAPTTTQLTVTLPTPVTTVTLPVPSLP